MANDDPGAKPAIFGILLGAITVLGGPVGLIAAGIAGASAYGLGRAIRRNRNAGHSQSNDYRDFSNYSGLKYEPPLSITELTGISQPTLRNQDYNSTYNLINSIADTSAFPTEELHCIREPVTRNFENFNNYTGINSIAGFQHNNEQDEPEPVQRRTRRRTHIDEYGQIWEE